MPLTSSLRMLAVALALTLGAAWGGAAWAQETETAEPDAEAATDPAPGSAADPATDADDGASATAPTDAEDEAEPANLDESGNTAEDPAQDSDAAQAETDTALEAGGSGPVGGADLPVIGTPRPAGIDFQPAASELARDVQWLDGMLNWIIGGITLLVVLLLAWVVVRFNEKRNPTPAGFTHNSPLEIAWTVIPIILLVFVGAFSLPVLFNQQEIPEADVRIKVTGYQWFWNYEYPDEGILFDSYMIGYGEGNLNESISAQLQEAGYSDSEFRLATDTPVVVPVGATVVMTVTGGDVIHSWTVPAFGVKQDAVPGRLAQLWFAAEAEGIYFGQCSELCGKDHAFMPITVRVVSQEVYDAWLEQARTDFPA